MDLIQKTLCTHMFSKPRQAPAARRSSRERDGISAMKEAFWCDDSVVSGKGPSPRRLAMLYYYIIICLTQAFWVTGPRVLPAPPESRHRLKIRFFSRQQKPEICYGH